MPVLHNFFFLKIIWKKKNTVGVKKSKNPTFNLKEKKKKKKQPINSGGGTGGRWVNSHQTPSHLLNLGDWILVGPENSRSSPKSPPNQTPLPPKISPNFSSSFSFLQKHPNQTYTKVLL